jgi:alkanesulfonate monooxygenase SsuD/methylene tetrahydromethanopterin reductase-like flavin-dependent oxidoreductase (luciferase family)
MEIIRRAWSEERFSYQSERYHLPPPGLTVSGAADDEPFDRLTLVPRPLRPVEVWQALISDETLHYAARHGHKGVIPLSNQSSARRRWRLYGELIARYQRRTPRPGEDRCLVVHVHLGDSREAAMASIRPAHDDRQRFLARQRPLLNYVDEQGNPFPYGRVPTLEESMAQAGWLVGEPEQVAAELQPLVAELGLEYLVVELEHAGLRRAQVTEQIERFAGEVMPSLGSVAAESALAPLRG